ncbi:hypothetical protein CC78DRAFT_195856 [Lojkania enalia]|uniref:Uncharacterized protein n=1 Tax=Lojkania enalia TaxID=147567 RepID=A0A9P4NBQ0_9PLEO|nr:hypothetical protein CC78DRAFT_195856 [Didymosphaeria enalia]
MACADDEARNRSPQRFPTPLITPFYRGRPYSPRVLIDGPSAWAASVSGSTWLSCQRYWPEQNSVPSPYFFLPSSPRCFSLSSPPSSLDRVPPQAATAQEKRGSCDGDDQRQGPSELIAPPIPGRLVRLQCFPPSKYYCGRCPPCLPASHAAAPSAWDCDKTLNKARLRHIGFQPSIPPRRLCHRLSASAVLPGRIVLQPGLSPCTPDLPAAPCPNHPPGY